MFELQKKKSFHKTFSLHDGYESKEAKLSVLHKWLQKNYQMNKCDKTLYTKWKRKKMKHATQSKKKLCIFNKS